MSQENVEAFKRGLEAGNRGDVKTLLEELDPEVEWHSALHALLGGNRRCFGDTMASARCSETSTRPSARSTSRSRRSGIGETNSSRSAASAHVARQAAPRPRRPWPS